MDDVRRRFLAGLAFLGVVYVVGTVGYVLIGAPDTTILNALYMTTITLSTVGFREAVAVEGDPTAQIFTIVLLIGGVGTLFYMLSTTTAFIVEGDLARLLGRRRMDKQISKMSNHYIVCGGGETARHAIGELAVTGRGVVFIDTDPERIERLSKERAIPYVQGDATQEDVLESAGIERAAGVIFTLPEDGDNILGVMTARDMAPRVRIVAKVVDSGISNKMLKAGANYVVSPNFIGAMRLASEMIRPEAVAFIDDMLRLRGKAIRLEEVVIGSEASLIGETIISSNIQHKTGFLVVAIREKGARDFMPSPPANRKFKPGDVLIVMGDPTRLAELRRFTGGVSSHQVTQTTLQKVSDSE